ncbi:MAG: hypothetical protein J0J01_03575 [Reyranella sp.]|uniref:hypothetical protein n=1 Tax=Reyranella sp. TaxID=1929291 RepID=UPI001AC58DBE|nr:hypothetical protein [Reyranella sp.]MBN9085967.1 hypothetical protein [Reyranella sp.]
MRTFTDAAFANVFALALDATNAGRRLNRWQVGGVEWCRERLSHGGPIYTFHCEVHMVTRAAVPAWRLLYVTETWWDEAGETAIRDARWGRLLQGQRSDVFAWFRARADRR